MNPSSVCCILPIFALGMCLLCLPACKSRSDGPSSSAFDDNWRGLFDGQTLGQWKITEFGGQGEVEVIDGEIHLPRGEDMTGITWTGPLMRMNYELELEAKRTLGRDFFCGLTFPVNDDPCTLVVGGWGGSVVGISSLDGDDAVNNETTTVLRFENDRWYRIRLRVTPHHLQAWIDDEVVVHVETTGRRIGIRPEVEKSVPLGIATWQTSAVVRNIRVRPVQGPVKIDYPW